MASSKLRAILTTAGELLSILQDRRELGLDIAQQIHGHLKQTFGALSVAGAAAEAQELDTLGTAIWNASAGVLHGHVVSRDPRLKPAHVPAPGVLARMFAFLMLYVSHNATPRRTKDSDQRQRILKVALRAGRLCLEQGQLDLAMTVLEKCSTLITQPVQTEDLVSLSEASTAALDRRERLMNDLTYEYTLLRIMHSWKASRLDLADHFFQNLSTGSVVRSAASASLQVKAADLYYELAKSLQKSGDRKAALEWYKRAFSALSGGDDHQYDQEAVELQLSVGVALVDELLASNEGSGYRQAEDVVTRLENTQNLANRLALLMLRFRLLASSPQADSEQTTPVLLQIIRLAVLTEDNFQLLLQTLRYAERVQPAIAVSALKVFISQRLLPEASVQSGELGQANLWLEKATISLVLLVTQQYSKLPSEQIAGDLGEIFDLIHAKCAAPFSTKATHAAQTLLWPITNKHDSTADQQFHQLLRHPIFANAGSINKGRIGRKLMRTSLESRDFPGAREIFFDMPASAQNEPGTRYLAFKLALNSKDRVLAISSLKIIVESADKDPAFLYACVLEAQSHTDMRDMAIATLRAVIDQRPAGVHLGSLLRCTARLFLAETPQDARGLENLATEILATFEMAANNMNDLRKATTEQWASEVQWWSKNAYNLAVRYSTQVAPAVLVDLLSICLKFLNHYSNDLLTSQANEVLRRKMMCLFLSTTALIAQGRSIEAPTQEIDSIYLRAQQTIQQYKALDADMPRQADAENIEARSFAMLKFELECVMKLQQWESLSPVLQSCLTARHTGSWDSLADTIIVMHEHMNQDQERSESTKLAMQLLNRAINDTWKRDKDMTKASRWLRFTFMLCLNHTEGDLSYTLLTQAARMARAGQGGKHDPYPEAELQWLAATGFNHAVDLLAAGDKEKAVSWIEASLEAARWAQDSGALHAILSKKKATAAERFGLGFTGEA